MADRSIVKIRDGKIVDTGKTRLPDGTIRVQPEGGIKFIPKTVKKAMGGEINAMKDGGDVPVPKRRPKKDQFRADKTESLDKEFSKKVAKQNEKNMKNVKKMEDGGLIGGQKKLDKNKDGKISGDDFAMMEMGGKVEEYGGGGKVKGGKMSCRGMGAALRGGGYTIS